jgi:hypothetical protein
MFIRLRARQCGSVVRIQVLTKRVTVLTQLSRGIVYHLVFFFFTLTALNILSILEKNQ